MDWKDTMKTKLSIVLLLAIALLVSSVSAAGNLEGDGKLSGSHETINIIGVPHDVKANVDDFGGMGSRLFVDRTGATQFFVNASNHYELLDRDGTDGFIGTGRLDPGLLLPYSGGEWRVQIYVRMLGPIDSSARWTTAYWDGSTWVQLAQWTMTKAAPSKFSVHTDDFLKDGYENMWWTLDQKTNFRIMQMRIYMEPVG